MSIENSKGNNGIAEWLENRIGELREEQRELDQVDHNIYFAEDARKLEGKANTLEKELEELKEKE